MTGHGEGGLVALRRVPKLQNVARVRVAMEEAHLQQLDLQQAPTQKYRFWAALFLSPSNSLGGILLPVNFRQHC